MGIRESLLNTITSVGSSDFVRIVTSAGASSKATLQNVIKSFETGLSAKSSLADSDYFRIVGSDNNLYKQSVNDVEKRIIEDYTGSSLGGAAQSVKSAFSAFRGIPSNTNKRLAYLGTSANFDTITAEWSLGLGSNGPTSNAFYYVHTIAFESAADGTVVNGKQIAYSYTTDTEAVYVRHRANNAWTSWQQFPTRTEIDALKNNGFIESNDYTAVDAEVTRIRLAKVGRLRFIYVVFIPSLSSGTICNLGSTDFGTYVSQYATAVRDGGSGSCEIGWANGGQLKYYGATSGQMYIGTIITSYVY